MKTTNDSKTRQIILKILGALIIMTGAFVIVRGIGNAILDDNNGSSSNNSNEVVGHEIYNYDNEESSSKKECTKCSGTGAITAQNSNPTPCAICGGVGQQYIPNLSYDMIMGWQGGYIACSGCGASGYINNISTQTYQCDKCNGTGYTK